MAQYRLGSGAQKRGQQVDLNSHRRIRSVFTPKDSALHVCSCRDILPYQSQRMAQHRQFIVIFVISVIKFLTKTIAP